MPKNLPNNALRIQKDSREYLFLVDIFWWVQERVSSILDRIYINEEEQFIIVWKKKHGGKLDTTKIFRRYHTDT